MNTCPECGRLLAGSPDACECHGAAPSQSTPGPNAPLAPAPVPRTPWTLGAPSPSPSPSPGPAGWGAPPPTPGPSTFGPEWSPRPAPTGVTLGVDVIVGVLAAIGIAISALLDWYRVLIVSISAMHLPAVVLFDPYSHGGGPKLGPFLVIIAGIALLAVLAGPVRPFRVPVALVALTPAVLFMAQTIRALSRSAGHVSFTSVVGAGPWVLMFAAAGLGVSAFLGDPDEPRAGGWVTIAVGGILLVVSVWALMNGTPPKELTASLPHDSAAPQPVTRPSTLISHTNACALVQPGGVTNLFDQHPAHVSVQYQGEPSCAWRAQTASRNYILNAAVETGDAVSAAEANSLTDITLLSGVGDKALLRLPKTGAGSMSVVVLADGQTLTLTYFVYSAVDYHPVDVSSARGRLIAIARAAAAHM